MARSIGVRSDAAPQRKRRAMRIFEYRGHIDRKGLEGPQSSLTAGKHILTVTSAETERTSYQGNAGAILTQMVIAAMVKTFTGAIPVARTAQSEMITEEIATSIVAVSLVLGGIEMHHGNSNLIRMFSGVGER